MKSTWHQGYGTVQMTLDQTELDRTFPYQNESSIESTQQPIIKCQY